jgi:hypothetical protein
LEDGVEEDTPEQSEPSGDELEEIERAKTMKLASMH